MNENKIREAWSRNPPRILSICQPMPNAPCLPLTGGSTTDKSLDAFLKDLKKDFENQRGKYFSYVMDYYESGDEADMYTLEAWQVCTPNDNVYEAVVILYYSAFNPYLAIKKHMDESLAQEYKEHLDQIERLEELISIE
ncbi:MAG TPA: hypothetical protein V6D33_12630 [Cyanophyceae cyanobacterium]